MFDPTWDYLYIHKMEYMAYLGTLYFIGTYMNSPWLFLIYFLTGYSIIFSDEEVEEMHDDDLEYDFFLTYDLTDFIELEELVLRDDSVLDLLQNGIEDPVLPVSYQLLDLYTKKFLYMLKKKHFFVKKYDYYIGAFHDINYENVTNFAKYSLKVSRELRREIILTRKTSLRKSKLVKYKTISITMNEYLTSSFFSLGLYSINDFDLDFFKAYNDFLLMQFPSYRHLYPTAKQYSIPGNNTLLVEDPLKSLNDVSNSVISVNEMNVLINQNIGLKNKTNYKKIKYV